MFVFLVNTHRSQVETNTSGHRANEHHRQAAVKILEAVHGRIAGSLVDLARIHVTVDTGNWIVSTQLQWQRHTVGGQIDKVLNELQKADRVGKDEN